MSRRWKASGPWVLAAQGDRTPYRVVSSCDNAAVSVVVRDDPQACEAVAAAVAQFLNQNYGPQEPRDLVGKLARQLTQEFARLTDRNCATDEAVARDVALHLVLSRIFLASMLQGEDSRVVDAARHDAAKRLGMARPTSAEPW